VNLQSNAWNQRTFKSETPLGYGLAKPAHQNEYGWMDVIMVGVTNMVNVHARIGLAKSAELLRDYWKELTIGIAATERAMDVAAWSEQIHFLVAVGYTDKKKVVAAVGKLQEAINKVERDALVLSIPVVLPLQLVVRGVRSRAREEGITLPKLFTPAEPNTAAFDEWLGLINEYRRFARMKEKAKARA
jgi:hypothetical protein